MTKEVEKPKALSSLAAGAGLSVSLVAGYLVCWLVAITPYATAFAHAWLGLFSALPIGSTDELVEGLIFSVVAAWFVALIFIPVYNLVARAARIV